MWEGMEVHASVLRSIPHYYGYPDQCTSSTSGQTQRGFYLCVFGSSPMMPWRVTRCFLGWMVKVVIQFLLIIILLRNYGICLNCFQLVQLSLSKGVISAM